MFEIHLGLCTIQIGRASWPLTKRAIHFFFQRRIRGWSDDDTWCLDTVIANFVLPRLKRFKELNNGMPNGLTEEKWDAILADIIVAMEYAAKDDVMWG